MHIEIFNRVREVWDNSGNIEHYTMVLLDSKAK